MKRIMNINSWYLIMNCAKNHVKIHNQETQFKLKYIFQFALYLYMQEYDFKICNILFNIKIKLFSFYTYSIKSPIPYSTPCSPRYSNPWGHDCNLFVQDGLKPKITSTLPWRLTRVQIPISDEKGFQISTRTRYRTHRRPETTFNHVVVNTKVKRRLLPLFLRFSTILA